MIQIAEELLSSAIQIAEDNARHQWTNIDKVYTMD